MNCHVVSAVQKIYMGSSKLNFPPRITRLVKYMRNAISDAIVRVQDYPKSLANCRMVPQSKRSIREMSTVTTLRADIAIVIHLTLLKMIP